MRIADIYGAGTGPVFSFEFFPPKTERGAANLMETVADLKAALAPDWVSVTYGAGGATRGRTLEVVSAIEAELGLTAMAHQTCVAASSADVEANVAQLKAAGIENILALRGDIPKEGAAPSEDFSHATDLLEFLGQRFEGCLGAACYPETHPEAQSPAADLGYALAKQELGAEFLITQIFFDNRHYLDYLGRARELGIIIPIVPGIMPITDVAQIERFTEMCGSEIPQELTTRLRRHAADPAVVMATGIEHAITQCRELLAAGAPGVHFYTLNKSHATRSILAALRG
ncbi:MAG: methylenetetrahydrofolate reductase [NAD(P)H] [Planctomycetota bacterium]|nr:methylenetetrahydrofolate reductase [NAD(P)H] [Planctomycetota bacterium]MDP6519127.1 methylenetetrahydrofolate reductase [NAD(P)H] [Planctomycetota bacterium]MDP6837532.1 methylenetetrahydrofolate reductase [NAD(P)H] [Planctomycetota bacterium]MDP6956709.1 methylenetetrahydrofolate reductase [NAD(P)H] [Planctomycetota bacterium]